MTDGLFCVVADGGGPIGSPLLFFQNGLKSRQNIGSKIIQNYLNTSKGKFGIIHGDERKDIVAFTTSSL